MILNNTRGAKSRRRAMVPSFQDPMECVFKIL